MNLISAVKRLCASEVHLIITDYSYDVEAMKILLASRPEVLN